MRTHQIHTRSMATGGWLARLAGADADDLGRTFVGFNRDHAWAGLRNKLPREFPSTFRSTDRYTHVED